MNRYFLFAAAAIALAACNNDVIDDDDNFIDEPVAAQITATIGQSNASRATDTEWVAGDAIGITTNKDKYINIKYITTNGDGVFSGSPIYFKNKAEKETFTAYYPFTGSEGTPPGIIKASTKSELQTPEFQCNFDFLYATVSDITGEDRDVKFEFAHQMSKITLTFVDGNGIKGTNIKVKSYTLDGLVLNGAFDPATGVAKADDNADPATLSFTLPEEGEKVSSLIIFPQTILDKLTLKIIDSENQTYTCELPSKDTSLSAGNNYQFTITVNKTGLTVNQMGITPWNNTKADVNAGSTDD